MAFVHVNAFANTFAFACERVWLGVQTFEPRVRYTLHLGGMYFYGSEL